MVNAADSAATSSSGDNVVKSKDIKSSVNRFGEDYCIFATNARYTPYHCASSNGLERGLAFGFGSIASIAFANPASPCPLNRTLNGDPFNNQNCDACGSCFAAVISLNFSTVNTCGVSICMNRDGE